jgi:hypothetical protein
MRFIAVAKRIETFRKIPTYEPPRARQSAYRVVSTRIKKYAFKVEIYLESFLERSVARRHKIET